MTSLRKPTVLVDMDEVLCDLIPTMVADVSRLYNLPDLSLEDIRGYSSDMWPAQVRQYFQDHAHTFAYYRCLPPAKGWEALKDYFSKFEIVVVTATPESKSFQNIVGAKKRWLAQHYPGAAYKFVSTSDKDVVYGDAIIDDHIDNLDKHTARWDSIPVLIQKPWNTASRGRPEFPDVAAALKYLEDVLLGDAKGRK